MIDDKRTLEPACFSTGSLARRARGPSSRGGVRARDVRQNSGTDRRVDDAQGLSALRNSRLPRDQIRRAATTPGSEFARGTGTLTVRSASMEHYRSVLATTAVMVFGLVASSPLIREQNSAAPPLQRGAVEASSSGGSEGWTDPPRQKVGLSIVTEAAASSRGHTGDRPAPRPASFTLLPPETAALLASDDFARGEFAKGEAGQRVQAVRRHRAAKVAARPRPAVRPSGRPAI